MRLLAYIRRTLLTSFFCLRVVSTFSLSVCLGGPLIFPSLSSALLLRSSLLFLFFSFSGGCLSLFTFFVSLDSVPLSLSVYVSSFLAERRCTCGLHRQPASTTRHSSFFSSRLTLECPFLVLASCVACLWGRRLLLLRPPRSWREASSC